MRLQLHDHDRDSAGLTYVYPVVSRRAGGVSIGINLNPNNACNWRCVYCQVEGLVFGNAPTIDLALLERELGGFLAQVLTEGWMERNVPEGSRRLNDIALSGNGEPTSSPQFEEVIELAARVVAKAGPPQPLKLVLITNGSLIHQERVQRGLAAMARAQDKLPGEAWFKLDSATDEGLERINSAQPGLARVRKNLELCARTCPTWIQTCVFRRNGAEPSEAEQRAYLAFLEELVRARVPVRGVLLYGLARKSYQPEAPELSPLPAAWLQNFAQRIEAVGLSVRVSP
jgi:wyosine [tRNA(Phe)-imidazoG37] synthetase (radical SAM superfamily)